MLISKWAGQDHRQLTRYLHLSFCFGLCGELIQNIQQVFQSDVEMTDTGQGTPQLHHLDCC